MTSYQKQINFFTKDYNKYSTKPQDNEQTNKKKLNILNIQQLSSTKTYNFNSKSIHKAINFLFI